MNMPQNPNPFDNLTKGPAYKKTDFAEGAEAVEEVPVQEGQPKKRKSKKDNPGYIEKDAQCMYRLNSNFYDEIKAFARLSRISVNTLMEEAVLAYLSSPENREKYMAAKQIAAAERNNKD